MKDKEGTILTLGEIEAELCLSGNHRPSVSFKSDDVPAVLRDLIPYAVVWGISDDWARQDIVSKTPELLRRNLQWVVQAFADPLDDWLAGAEAESADPSDAYIAFSAMRMAADLIR